MARDLREIQNGREPYELEFKNAGELVAVLKERGLLIDVDEDEAKYWIETVGYFHLKGYLSCLKEPIKRKGYRAGTKLSDALQLLQWERNLRSVVLEQIGKVEIRLRSAIVECIGTGFGTDYFLEHNYDVTRMRNSTASKQSPRSTSEQLDWEWFVNWLDEEISKVFMRGDSEFVRGHLKKRKSQHLPLWILVETMSLGDLIIIYQRLSPKNRTFVASKFANTMTAGGQLKENEFLWILEAIRTLRNLASHFNAFFDKRFPFPPLSEFRIKFRECPYFPSLSAARKNCSTYEVILMLLYLEPAVQRDSSFSTKVAEVLESFPNTIQGVSPRNYGGHKGWQHDTAWQGSVETTSEMQVGGRDYEKYKSTKGAHTRRRRRAKS